MRVRGKAQIAMLQVDVRFYEYAIDRLMMTCPAETRDALDYAERQIRFDQKCAEENRRRGANAPETTS